MLPSTTSACYQESTNIKMCASYWTEIHHTMLKIFFFFFFVHTACGNSLNRDGTHTTCLKFQSLSFNPCPFPLLLPQRQLLWWILDHILSLPYISTYKHHPPTHRAPDHPPYLTLPTYTLFIRGRLILYFPRAHVKPPSLCGDPELHMDGAWLGGESPGYLFKT